MKQKGNYVNNDRSKPIKLPNLKGVYNKHPGEGLGRGGVVRKLCGLCGSVHGPGEPHNAK
tara:strand:+ start:639 stop:818 length:180 start_codon:yes stop_codon:yes gene_type:complete